MPKYSILKPTQIIGMRNGRGINDRLKNIKNM